MSLYIQNKDETELGRSSGFSLPKLTLEQQRSISLFCDIAIENGSSISLDEILLLSSLDVSVKDLRQIWCKSPLLQERYELDEAGWVTSKKKKKNKTEENEQQDPQRKYQVKSDLNGEKRRDQSERLDRSLRAERNISFSQNPFCLQDFSGFPSRTALRSALAMWLMSILRLSNLQGRGQHSLLAMLYPQ